MTLILQTHFVRWCDYMIQRIFYLGIARPIFTKLILCLLSLTYKPRHQKAVLQKAVGKNF